MCPRVITFYMDQISEHQRDLTNSASQRFIADYVSGFTMAVARMNSVVKGLQADKEGMARNLQGAGGKVKGGVLYDSADPATQLESQIREKRLHFGLVFQSFNLFPQYTALGNVMLAPTLHAKERPDYKQNKAQITAQIEAQARDLLTEIGLEDRMDSYPHQLSGGQCQRVAIARALALKPDILCFDEPTSALDPELTGEVLKVIKGLAQVHTTMIIVTHEMAFARDVASQVIFMDGGTICEQGPPEQVFGNPRNERTKQFLSRYNEDR